MRIFTHKVWYFRYLFLNSWMFSSLLQNWVMVIAGHQTCGNFMDSSMSYLKDCTWIYPHDVHATRVLVAVMWHFGCFNTAMDVCDCDLSVIMFGVPFGLQFANYPLWWLRKPFGKRNGCFDIYRRACTSTPWFVKDKSQVPDLPSSCVHSCHFKPVCNFVPNHSVQT